MGVVYDGAGGVVGRWGGRGWRNVEDGLWMLQDLIGGDDFLVDDGIGHGRIRRRHIYDITATVVCAPYMTSFSS